MGGLWGVPEYIFFIMTEMLKGGVLGEKTAALGDYVVGKRLGQCQIHGSTPCNILLPRQWRIWRCQT